MAHELVHLTLGYYDFSPPGDFVGATVRYTNAISAEMGWPLRMSYVANPGDQGSNKTSFTGDRRVDLAIWPYDVGDLKPSDVYEEDLYLFDIDLRNGDVSRDLIIGNDADNEFFGGDGGDVLRGAGGDDRLFGDDGSDFLYGDQGNDFISGGNGDDRLYGGAGDDRLRGGEGTDEINGGLGKNTALYDDAGGRISVDLAVGTGRSEGGPTTTVDRLINIQNVVGSKYNDVLVGDGGDNILAGGYGADKIYGGLGADTASYASSTGAVAVNLSVIVQGRVLGVGGDAQGDELRGIENLIGSSNLDTLTGSSGANVIAGGPGADLMDGAGGIDTLDYSGSLYRIEADLGLGLGAGSGDSLGDIFKNFEKMTGSPYADIVVAKPGERNPNMKTVEVGRGNDHVSASLAGMQIDGGGGVDWIIYEKMHSGVSVNLTNGFAKYFDPYQRGSDALLNFENIRGTEYRDRLVGNEGNNVIEGGAGGDFIDGGDGLDTISFESSRSSVIMSLSGGERAGDAAGENIGGIQSADIYVSIENIKGSRYDDTLIGDDADNIIDGGGGSNKIDGALGSDTVSYAGSTGRVLVDLRAGSASTGQSRDILARIENIMGSAHDDELYGDDGANIIHGGAGDDTIRGRSGNDALVGGAGEDDIYGGEGDNVIRVDDDLDSDLVYLGAGRNVVHSGPWDTIYSGTGAGVIYVKEDPSGFWSPSALVYEGGSHKIVTSNPADVLVSLYQLTHGVNVKVLEGRALIDEGEVDGGEVIGAGSWIEGTKFKDVIDASGSSEPVTVYDSWGEDEVIGSRLDDFLFPSPGGSVSAGRGNDTVNFDCYSHQSSGTSSAFSADGGEGFDIFDIFSLSDERVERVSISLQNGRYSVEVDGRVVGSLRSFEGFSNEIESDFEFLGGQLTSGVLIVSSGISTNIETGAGEDEVVVSIGGGAIKLGAGDDYIELANGSPAHLKIFGGDGFDTLSFFSFSAGVTFDLGVPVNDLGRRVGSIEFTSIEAMVGSEFDDRLTSSAEGAKVDGGFGDDSLSGGIGSDFLIGGEGDDKLLGLGGDDRLEGGDGDDMLNGGDGDDILYGSIGDDVLTGGDGADCFAFVEKTFGQDVNKDFNLARGDRIWLSDSVATDYSGVQSRIAKESSGVYQGSVSITFGDDAKIILQGVTDIGKVTADYFLFG